METKDGYTNLEATLRSGSTLMGARQKDAKERAQFVEDLKVGHQVMDDLIRAKNGETRRLKDPIRMIGGIRSFNRLARKIGWAEIPVVEMM